MESDRINKINNLKRGCEFCIDVGVNEPRIHCLIAMVLLGVQNDMTECHPTPIANNICETALKNPNIKNNRRYKKLQKQELLLGH